MAHKKMFLLFVLYGTSSLIYASESANQRQQKIQAAIERMEKSVLDQVQGEYPKSAVYKLIRDLATKDPHAQLTYSFPLLTIKHREDLSSTDKQSFGWHGNDYYFLNVDAEPDKKTTVVKLTEKSSHTDYLTSEAISHW